MRLSKKKSIKKLQKELKTRRDLLALYEQFNEAFRGLHVHPMIIGGILFNDKKLIKEISIVLHNRMKIIEEELNIDMDYIELEDEE